MFGLKKLACAIGLGAAVGSGWMADAGEFPSPIQRQSAPIQRQYIPQRQLPDKYERPSQRHQYQRPYRKLTTARAVVLDLDDLEPNSVVQQQQQQRVLPIQRQRFVVDDKFGGKGKVDGKGKLGGKDKDDAFDKDDDLDIGKEEIGKSKSKMKIDGKGKSRGKDKDKDDLDELGDKGKDDFDGKEEPVAVQRQRSPKERTVRSRDDRRPSNTDTADNDTSETDTDELPEEENVADNDTNATGEDLAD